MPSRAAFASPSLVSLSPMDFRLFTGLEIPDPITFVLGPQWLNRPQLYPRQATLLKVIFLREDLFSEYDYEVVGEWEASFRTSGNNGITPNILWRMRHLRELGYRYFREVLLVLGRRAGKGYVSALAMAYVMWGFMAKGDPQTHYGIDRDKQLACFIYAGKKEQARENLWKDLVNVITGSHCFTPYISRALGESLTVFAPHDLVRIKKLFDRGTVTERDLATFVIQPKEATLMSGRGPASYCQAYDEMAHLVKAGGASRSAEEVYNSATPALDQFKKDAFIIEPSSPWQMIGQFYQNWEDSLAEDEEGNPEFPMMMMLQLASWEIYYDWEVAHQLPVFPEGFEGDLGEYKSQPHPVFQQLKGAIQEYDDRMEKLEKSNPDTFKVERRSYWQTVVDAYLDPTRVEAIFKPDLQMTTTARNLTTFYKGHADPSKVNDNFAVAIAHPEPGDDGYLRCRFDYIHHWVPAEFPDHTIDYIEIEDRLFDLVWGFKTDEFTFDQHNSAMPIQRLNKRIRGKRSPKRITIYEQTATATHNWTRAECFKVAINQGWVEAPEYETAELELKFLQRKTTATTNKVVHQETGPVVHDDVATAMMECVWRILGEQVNSWTHGALSEFKPDATLSGGFDPYHAQSPDARNPFSQLSGLGRTRTSNARAGGHNPARNVMANRRR